MRWSGVFFFALWNLLPIFSSALVANPCALTDVLVSKLGVKRANAANCSVPRHLTVVQNYDVPFGPWGTFPGPFSPYSAKEWLTVGLHNKSKSTSSVVSRQALVLFIYVACLAKYASGFNTQAVGETHKDGSDDFGIFQINDKYCRRGTKASCGVSCTDLVSDNLVPSATCALAIYEKEGFAHWPAWKNNCRDINVSRFIDRCEITPKG